MSHDRDPLNDLNELAQLQPDAVVTERAVERAGAAISALPSVSAAQKNATRNWNAQLWRPRNLLVVAAAVLLLVFGTQSFLTRSDSNFAFAQVQEQVAKTKTVQYTQKEQFLTSTPGKYGHEILRRVMVLGPEHKREEITIIAEEIRDFDIIVGSKGSDSGESNKLPQSLADQIAKMEGVQEVAPALTDIIEIPEMNILGLFLQGWAPRSLMFGRLTLLHGRPFTADDDRKVLVGYKLAARLKKNLGDTITILGEPLEIVGIYDSKTTFENIGLIVPLVELQQLTARPNEVSGFFVKVSKPVGDLGLNKLRQRIESLHSGIFAKLASDAYSPYSPSVLISDQGLNETISLHPSDKTYRKSAPADVEFFDAISAEGKPLPSIDFYDLIRNVPTETAKQVGERLVNGKKLAGFVVEKKRELQKEIDTWKRTYWVDPVSKLPVRIETTHRCSNPMSSESDSVIDDIVFDNALDPALFSTDPPVGYTEIGTPAGGK